VLRVISFGELLDPRLLQEVGDLGKSDLSLLTPPTLHRTRIEADEASLRQRCANANAERVLLGLSAYVF
jgi:hypothetical protein